MKKFLRTAWGARFVNLVMIAIYWFFLSMDHSGANAIVGFLAWSTTVLSLFALFNADEIASEVYRKRGVIPSYVEMDGVEKMIWPVIIACLLLFNGWIITGIVYGIFLTGATILLSDKYLTLLEDNGEIPKGQR